MKYVISVEMDTDTEAFEFSTEEDRKMFIRAITKMNPNVEYSTTEILEGDPEPMIDKKEEEPWKAEVSTHMSIQLVSEFDIPMSITPYELLRYKFIPSIPILVYRVAGKLVYTQERAPEGEVTTSELMKWTETLKDVDGSAGPLQGEILRASFDVNKLRTKTKTIPK
jgi:hypothetical protein